MVFNSGIPKEIERLFALHIRQPSGGGVVGPYGTLRFSCFLDLLSAVHQPEALELLANALSQRILSTPITPDLEAVAIPKHGNCLLGALVAKKVGKRTIFVRRDIIFGKRIEGTIAPRDKVILVDDVASDGALLMDVIQGLRHAGLHIERVFVFVNRSEGDAKQTVEGERIPFDACYDLDDDQLHKIYNSARA
jgi:orotate phosphoribosyltransferase